MGGILSGIIGGMAKGVTGGLTAEGERRRKEEETQRDLIGRMHLQRLADWENLSPEEQEGHIKGLEAIYPEAAKKGIFRAGVQLASAIAPHINQATLQPIKEVDPLADVARQTGLPTSHLQRTPAQEELLRKELYGQNFQEAERKRKEALIAQVPHMTEDESKRALVEIGTGVKLPMPVKETFVKEGNYIDKDNVQHNIRVSTRNPGHMEDTRTGQIISTLPADWILQGAPVAPQLVTSPSGVEQAVDRSALRNQMRQTGQTSMVVPGVKGRVQFPPVSNVTYNTPQGLITVPTPRNEATAIGKQALKAAGGDTVGNVTPDFRNPLTTKGQDALTQLLPVKAQFQGLLKDLEDIKDNNTPLTYLGDRGLYAIGRATDAAALISNLELAKITGAMPYAKASRNFQYFKQIQQHLGNVKTDSPKLLYSKLKNAMRNFDEMEKDIRDINVKGARPTAGLSAPPAATTSDTVRVRNKATGQTGSLPKVRLQEALASGKYEEIK